MSFPHPYHESSDADDEYDQDISPHPVSDGEESDGESDESDHTPTTYGNFGDDGLPRAIITEWTAEECADFIGALGLDQYFEIFMDNNVVGEVLIALDHELLKEMEIMSMGHRLRILKSVYDVKMSQDIPIEPDHYVPLSMSYFEKLANSAAADDGLKAQATQADLLKLKEMIRIRDDRIIQIEKDLRKITDEHRKLREEFLPLAKFAKDRSQPLPPTNETQSYNSNSSKHQKPPAILTESRSTNGISRKTSVRNNVMFSGKVNSPTHIPIAESPAVQAVSTQHATIPSPTSPNNLPNSAPIPRSYAQVPASASRVAFANDRDGDSSMADRSQQRSQASRHYPSGTTATSGAPTPEPPGSAGLNSTQSPSVEIFKSFRVAMDDPCHKVLPAALKQYKIEADWRTYALYIVYGDEERCLGLDEKPLTLFKQLMHEGRKPMFMLRKLGSTENEPLPSGFGPGPSPMPPGMSSSSRYGQSQATASSVPGGLL